MLTRHSTISKLSKTNLLMLITLTIISVVAGLTVFARQNGNVDEEGIKTTIGNYFKGHETEDASYIRKAFWPTARIEGVYRGKIESISVDEFCKSFLIQSDSDKSKRVRKIDAINYTGNAAMVKLTFDYGNIVVTDYLIMLKIDGEWKISSKIYNAKKIK